jgi:hypothetical protein
MDDSLEATQVEVHLTSRWRAYILTTLLGPTPTYHRQSRGPVRRCTTVTNPSSGESPSATYSSSAGTGHMGKTLENAVDARPKNAQYLHNKIWDLIPIQHQYNNCTITLHMRADLSMWDLPSCEGLLYSCCIGVVNLTFFIKYKEVILTLTLHNYDTTPRHNGVGSGTEGGGAGRGHAPPKFPKKKNLKVRKKNNLKN